MHVEYSVCMYCIYAGIHYGRNMYCWLLQPIHYSSKRIPFKDVFKDIPYYYYRKESIWSRVVLGNKITKVEWTIDKNTFKGTAAWDFWQWQPVYLSAIYPCLSVSILTYLTVCTSVCTLPSCLHFLPAYFAPIYPVRRNGEGINSVIESCHWLIYSYNGANVFCFLSSLPLLPPATVSPVRACLSMWLERFRGSQKEDELWPLSSQFSQ